MHCYIRGGLPLGTLRTHEPCLSREAGRMADEQPIRECKRPLALQSQQDQVEGDPSSLLSLLYSTLLCFICFHSAFYPFSHIILSFLLLSFAFLCSLNLSDNCMAQNHQRLGHQKETELVSSQADDVTILPWPIKETPDMLLL